MCQDLLLHIDTAPAPLRTSDDMLAAMLSQTFSVTHDRHIQYMHMLHTFVTHTNAVTYRHTLATPVVPLQSK